MEAVEIGIELRQGGLGRQLQRIEVGCEMADHAIGADQLDGADGFLGGGPQILLAGRRACLGLPLAGERADQLAVLELHLDVAPPSGSAAQLGRRQAAFVQLGEIGPPALIHGIGVFLVAGVERLDEGRIGAEEKRALFQEVVGVVGRLLCHFKSLGGLLGRSSRAGTPARRRRGKERPCSADCAALHADTGAFFCPSSVNMSANCENSEHRSRDFYA